MPKRSRSYREAPACIISTAQHARPKVIGHIEPVRPQLMTESRLVVTKPFSITPFVLMASIPLQSALRPLVNKADDKDAETHHHGNKTEQADFIQHHCPWEQKGYLQIEQNKQNCYQIVAHVEFHAGVFKRLKSAFIWRQFLAIWTIGT